MCVCVNVSYPLIFSTRLNVSSFSIAINHSFRTQIYYKELGLFSRQKKTKKDGKKLKTSIDEKLVEEKKRVGNDLTIQWDRWGLST